MEKILLMLAGSLMLLGFACAKAPAADAKAGLDWVLPSEDGVLPAVNSGKVSGDIITAGSSTVFPLSERMAERFKEEGYAGNITIDSIGSGAGFERFCVSGETDISNASRPIKATEVDSARSIGREPLEFRMGTDALAIVVSKQNNFLKDVSLAELKTIFSSAEYWSDVNPAWPQEKIQRFIPGTDSGTFDYFAEEVMGKNKALLLGATNVQMSEDDNVLVQGVLGSPYAVGFFGFAYYVENKDKVKVVAVDGVIPDAESVDKGTYELARPLFLYSTAKIMQEKPQVAAFLAFYLSYVTEEISKVGYFPASAEVIAASKAVWNKAMEGIIKK